MTSRENTRYITADMARCRQCGKCVLICPNDVFEWHKRKLKVKAAGRCIRCGHCVAVCPEEAFVHSNIPSDTFLKIDPFFELPTETLETFYATRRSCRCFKDTELSVATVDTLLSTARFAPTATNSQNVRFIVLDHPTFINGLERLTVRHYLKLKRQLDNPFLRFAIRMVVGKSLVQAYRYHLPSIVERFKAIEEGRQSLFYGAPVVVIAYASGLPHIAAANCNLATMEIFLAAEAMRLGTCYNGYALTAMVRDKRVREAMSIPKGYTPGAVFALGEPDVAFLRAPPRRLPRVTRFSL